MTVRKQGALLHRVMYCLWLTLFVVLSAAPTQAITLHELSIKSSLRTESVHFTFDAPYPPKAVFTLNNPPRIVVDIPLLNTSLGSAKIAVPKSYDGNWLNDVRSGTFNPTTTRVVLDVTSPMQVSHTIDADNNRLSITYLPRTPPQEAPQTSSLPSSQNTHNAPLLVYSRIPKVKPQAGVSANINNAYANLSSPRLKPSHGTRKPIIIIDAGHGGKDNGAQGRKGTREKDLTLQMAKKLKHALDKTGEFRAILTRTDDRFLLLKERVQLARQASGDIFISLHADANRHATTRGFSIYTLSEEASDGEAAELAAQENKSDIIDGVDLSGQDEEVTSILIDLMQRETNNTSSRLADILIENMPKAIKGTRNTHRYAGFRVLKAPDIPSVLIEMGFLTNREDERLLNDKAYQKMFIEGLVQGLEAFQK